MVRIFLSSCFLLASTFLFFISCDNEPSSTEQEKVVCTPTSIVTSDVAKTYEYDNKYRLIRHISYDNNLVRFEYENDKMVRAIFYQGTDETSVIDLVTIEYNKKGQWISQSHSYDGEIDNAEYDAEGNRTSITSTLDDKITRTHDFTYGNDNMIDQTVTYFDSNGAVEISRSYSYEYDATLENKLALFQEATVFLETEQQPTPSRNMVKTFNTLESDGTTVSTVGHYKYEYNELGFPTKSTFAGNDLNGDGIQTSQDTVVINYEYICPL